MSRAKTARAEFLAVFGFLPVGIGALKLIYRQQWWIKAILKAKGTNP